MHLLLFQLLAIISSREISADPFPDSLSSPTIPEAHQHPAHAWDTGPGWDNGNENSYNQNNLIPTPTIPDELLFDPGYDTNNFLARAPADPTAFHNFKSFICAGSDSVCCLGNPLASARDAEACTESMYPSLPNPQQHMTNGREQRNTSREQERSGYRRLIPDGGITVPIPPPMNPILPRTNHAM